mgnify:CR=1 FL=1
MKTKTIKKVISVKMNQWLESITDQKLREDVKGNILVSGGCIASMLTKEDVNDYDVYIQDMDVLKRLADYYCKGKVLDGRKRDHYLKSKLPEIFENDGIIPFGENEGEKYVSEEYVRLSNLKPDQIKLDINGVVERFEIKEDEKYQVVFLSQNAISLSDDIQVVLRFNGNAEQIHKTFDFIHATNYFTFKDGLVLNSAALESLITKNLVYQGSLYPLTSIIRMKKFLARGYTMNAGEVLKIMFQISLLDLKDIEVLEEQLIGVDVAYFSTLIEALRNVDPNKLTTGYMNELIDRIFNQYEEE